MIIERLDLIAFGQFTGAVLDLAAGPNRFHIVYGPNESGKSTSMRAIHSLLFGMPQRSDDDFIHQYSAMRIGGQFRDAVTGEVLQCVRRRGRTKTLVTPDESDEVDPARLAAMLRGVDAETFSRQFGLSHKELVAGGRAILDGGGDLGEMLFAAGTGTGTLRAARAQLEKDRRELFIERGSAGTINKLIARFAETDKQLRDCRLLPTQYDSKHKELDQAIIDASQTEQQLKSKTQANRLIKAYLKAHALLPDRQNIVALLGTSIGSTPLLDDDFIASRRKLETKRHATSQQLDSFREQVSELLQRRELLKVDTQWTKAAPTIRSLMNELSEIVSGQKQLQQLRVDLSETESQISAAIKRLGQTASEAFNATNNSLSENVDELAISETIRKDIDAMVTRYAGLIESIQSTQDNVASLTQAKAEIAEKLEQMPPAPDITPLVDALADIGKPRILIDAVAKCHDEEKKSLRAVNDSLAGLRGFSGSVDDVRRYLPPSESEIARLSAAISDAKSELHKRLVTLETDQEKLRESQSIYQEFACDSDLPTPEQQQQARIDRDATVAKLHVSATNRESIDTEIIETLEAQIRVADQMTDQLHQAYDQVMRRKRSLEDVARSQRQVDVSIEFHRAAQQNLDAAVVAWKELWQAHQVVAGTPDEMQLWLANLATLKKLITAWDDQSAAVSSAQAAVDRAVAQLSTTMRLSDESTQDKPQTPPASDLTEVYALATLRKDDALRRINDRKHCEDELKRADTALAKSLSDLKRHERQYQQWQDQWREVLSKIAVTPSASPKDIHGIIRQIDEVQLLRQKRDSITASLQSLKQSQQDYQSRVEAVAGQLKVDFAQNDLTSFVKQLSLQSDEYQKCDNEREVLDQHVETLKQKIRVASDEEQALLAQLRSLCIEAGADDISQLPAIEQASAKRRELERDLQTIDQQLRAIAAGEPLDTFVEQASGQDVASLEIELSKSEAELERLQQRWAAALETVGKLRGEVEQMDASDQAAIIQQERQNLLAAMRRHANRYAELTIAEDALKRAIDHYRENNEGPVLRLASNYFSRLTDGEYGALQIEFDDKDQPKLMGVRPNSKASVVAHLMSDGTADALYLSLRLASLEVHLDTHNPIPLIVDDCLVQFDDDRAAAALQILSEMSTRTQVILFTHHQHLLELAAENLPPGGFHSHRLDKQFVTQAIGQA
jgi:uncharacterized protein YhaN